MKAKHASVVSAARNCQTTRLTARYGKYSLTSWFNNRQYSGPIPAIMAPVLSVNQNGPSVERR